jgi:hypothetical protein
MSLSAWEQQALDSIKDGLAGSDPELAALLSAFTQLASGKEKPDREKVRVGSPRALRRLRRARRRSNARRAWQRLRIQRTVLLLLLLATATMIAVALAINVGGDPGTCTGTAAVTCVGQAPEHSPGSPSDKTTTYQAPQQPAIWP